YPRSTGRESVELSQQVTHTLEARQICLRVHLAGCTARLRQRLRCLAPGEHPERPEVTLRLRPGGSHLLKRDAPRGFRRIRRRQCALLGLVTLDQLGALASGRDLIRHDGGEGETLVVPEALE